MGARSLIVHKFTTVTRNVRVLSIETNYREISAGEATAAVGDGVRGDKGIRAREDDGTGIWRVNSIM